MNTYGKRLAKGILFSKQSRKSLAENMGITVQGVGSVIRGDSGSFTSENNSKAAAFLKINPDWLATGEGKMEAGALTVADKLVAGALTTQPSIKAALEVICLALRAAPEDQRDKVAQKLGMLAYAPDSDALFRATHAMLELHALASHIDLNQNQKQA